jgi:outer membrane protein OmpA-like peptidoglycan-associated protein
MKKLFLPLLFVFSMFLYSPHTEAQILKKVLKKSTKAAEKAVVRKTEQKVYKETSKTMDTIYEGKSKKDRGDGETNNKEEKGVLIRGGDGNDSNTSTNENTKPEEDNSSEKLKPWSKYNFVPGDKVIFQDDLTGEESGEFPSRWDLIKGSAENASFDGGNVINFENKSIITPLMETDEYLPEVFTIEFDAYYDEQRMDSYVYHQLYKIRFWNGDSYVVFRDLEVSYNPINIYRYGASLSGKVKGVKKEFEGFEGSLKQKQPVWRHIAIAFNKRSLKVFVDQYRALNIPNLGFKPTMVSIETYTNTHIKEPYVRAIKNIRIAEGGKKLYERVMADGKFVTNGILFDVNKATIKPESMGVINEIVKMMNEHPELKFSIEGHTDSDGSENSNQILSGKRSESVKEALAGLGIDSSRMQTKGFGESVPMDSNTTPEGKANNRRVEFIKI